MVTIAEDGAMELGGSRWIISGEEPGTGWPVGVCPYCAMGYPVYVMDQNGAYEEAEMPRSCKRCGAPMDFEAVHKEGGYADQVAEGEKGAPQRAMNRMMRQPKKSKAEE